MVKIDRSLIILIAGVAAAALLAIVGTVVLVEIAGAEFLPARLLSGQHQVTDSAIILATRPPATPTATEPAPPTVTPEPPRPTPVATAREDPTPWEAPADTAPQPTVVVPLQATEPNRLDDVAKPAATALPATPTETPAAMGVPDDAPVTPPTEAATATPDLVDPTPDVPTATGVPEATPSSVPTEPINLPAVDLPPATSGSGFDDLADFEDYLRARRTTVAGQPFEILTLTLDEEQSTSQRFALAVAAGEGSDVFVEQTPEDLLTFGRSLLEDVKRYVGDACEITLESTYAVTHTETCLTAPDWCAINAPEGTDSAATITWTYLRGSYVEGVDTLDVWNANAQGQP